LGVPIESLFDDLAGLAGGGGNGKESFYILNFLFFLSCLHFGCFGGDIVIEPLEKVALSG
jgi:hypothetical protein